ncbi:MAG TPA: hypothetical protein VFX50_18655, partial [Gemmatimonadales bacterium]|nr:hypothetical protein [Gemmatimonadales bacterium]
MRPPPPAAVLLLCVVGCARPPPVDEVAPTPPPPAAEPPEPSAPSPECRTIVTLPAEDTARVLSVRATCTAQLATPSLSLRAEGGPSAQTLGPIVRAYPSASR